MSLIAYLKEFDNKMQRRLNADISQATYQKYLRCANHIVTFLDHTANDKDYLLQRINGDFLDAYFQYLRAVKNISHNSSAKYMVCFKTILMPAIKSGRLKPDPFINFKIRMKPWPEITLALMKLTSLKIWNMKALT